jgi:hypothetical protein
MNPQSNDLFSSGYIQHYSNRLRELHDICLVE